jgi:uncharacterized protein (DUF1800 family)
VRALLAAVALVATLAASAPARAASAPIGFDGARHLLNRTSFAANPPEIELFAKLSREQAADRLLGWTLQPMQTRAPEWVNDYQSPRRLRNATEAERLAFQREQVQRGLELRGWWFSEMLVTPSPLTEKMVLFWHNHFVSSQQKVRSAVLMYRQNQLLRQYALGSYADLLHAAAKDPAMLIYLDGANSRKGQPNENFAREVMELFTLGEGRYSEQDIKEAARAFTGWSVDIDTGTYLYRPLAHDDGVKTVFGKSGNFDGDAVLDLILAKPETAEFIVAKLWREFVSPTPDPKEVARIARQFRDNRYNIKVALRGLLISDAFYAPDNRAALVKSPVDLVVGTLRQFRFETGDAVPFALATRQLGQDLFGPPNVKGWPGGEAWINSTSLLARKQFLERLFRAQEMPQPVMVAAMTAPPVAGNAERKEEPKGAAAAQAAMRLRYLQALQDIRFDGDRWLAPYQAEPGRLPQVVLAQAPASPPPSGAQGVELLRALVLDPVYQLK